MKKIILITLCILLLITPSASASIGSKGLIVNRGVEEIELQKGEKTWIFVQDGFSKLPLLKGLSFYSDNTVIFTVGLHSGVLRGNAPGTAKLSIVSNQGHCAYITVRVTAHKKSGLLFPFLLIAALFTFLLIYIKQCK